MTLWPTMQHTEIGVIIDSLYSEHVDCCRFKSRAVSHVRVGVVVVVIIIIIIIVAVVVVAAAAVRLFG